MDDIPISRVSEDNVEPNWPDRRTLNVRLLFDTNKIDHDLPNIRNIIDTFEHFKHGIIAVNTNVKDCDGRMIETKKWRGITLHSEELNRALKDQKFCKIRRDEYDSDETFCTDVSLKSGTSNSVLMHAKNTNKQNTE